jgi:hypothetical protein
LQTVGDALIAKPDDADAIILQHEATGLGDIQKAQKSGNQGDYIGGEEYLTMALQALPDNAQAKQLLADYKTHEPEQIERQRVERLNRPKAVYDATLGEFSDANLFDDHELNSSKSAALVAGAIEQSLVTVQPGYKIIVDNEPKPDTYLITASQDDNGLPPVRLSQSGCAHGQHHVSHAGGIDPQAHRPQKPGRRHVGRGRGGQDRKRGHCRSSGEVRLRDGSRLRQGRTTAGKHDRRGREADAWRRIVSAIAIPSAKFRLGKIVSTANALEHLSQDDILLGIQRHQAGDWGDVPSGNSAANERALIEVPAIRRHVADDVQSDGKFQVTWIEIHQMIRPRRRNVVQKFLGQVSVRVNDADAVAECDVLQNQIAEQRRFS